MSETKDKSAQPLPAPLTPPEKQCPECKGEKTVVAWLGETKPCPKCGGTGSVIEVVEEKLTPWQQRVEKMLAQILAYVEPGVARDEAGDGEVWSYDEMKEFRKGQR